MRPGRAILLSAGFGTRMGELTRECPKPLLPVAGQPLIDHGLDRLQAAGVGEVVVNLHYLGDMIRAHLASRATPRVTFSKEETLLDTGGGIVKALPLLGPEPFFAINSDSIWTGPDPLATLRTAWRPEMGALLLLVRRENARAYTRAGDFLLGDGGRPVRRGTAPDAPYVYTGAQIIAPAAFDAAPDGPFSTNVIWDRLLSAGRLYAVVHEGGWVDVGTPAGLAEADRAVAGDAP